MGSGLPSCHENLGAAEPPPFGQRALGSLHAAGLDKPAAFRDGKGAVARTEHPPASFASLHRQLRRHAGLTQEQLAEAARLSPQSVSDLERGINLTARRETARLLADALNLTGSARAGFEAAASGTVTAGGSPWQSGSVGGLPVATRTLPRDVASFTGRESELEQLVARAAGAASSGGVVRIHAIGG